MSKIRRILVAACVISVLIGCGYFGNPLVQSCKDQLAALRQSQKDEVENKRLMWELEKQLEREYLAAREKEKAKRDNFIWKGEVAEGRIWEPQTPVQNGDSVSDVKYAVSPTVIDGSGGIKNIPLYK